MKHHLQVLGTSTFAEEIAHRLDHVADVTLTSSLSCDGLVVAVFDHMADDELIQLQDTMATNNPLVRLLPVVWQFPQLVVGPSFGGGETGCFACFVRRRRQHSSDLAVTDAIARDQRRNRAGGPRMGFVAGHAAALIHQWLDDGRPGERVSRFSVVDHRHQHLAVVGVHGCEHCGLGLAGETKTVDHLDLPVLADLGAVR